MSMSPSASRAGAADDYLQIELTDVLVSSYAAGRVTDDYLRIELSDVLVSSYASGRVADDCLHVELSDVLVSSYAAEVHPGDTVQLVGAPAFDAMFFA